MSARANELRVSPIDQKMVQQSNSYRLSPTQPALKSVISAAAKREGFQPHEDANCGRAVDRRRTVKIELQQHHSGAEHEIRSEARLASSRDCERKLTRYLTNSKDCERLEHKKNKYNRYDTKYLSRSALPLCLRCCGGIFSRVKRNRLMDKYELLLALNDLRRTPKEEEKYLQTFAQSAKCQPQMDA